MISQALGQHAGASGLKGIVVQGLSERRDTACLLALDEAFAADGLLPMLVSMVQQRPGFHGSPLCLVADPEQGLIGWRVRVTRQLSSVQMRSLLVLLKDELSTLIASSDSQSQGVVSLDSRMWQRLLWQRSEGLA